MILANGSSLSAGRSSFLLQADHAYAAVASLLMNALRRKPNDYGAAGPRPQVVWSNGVLASIATGLLTQILTPWYPDPPAFVYLEYDGNKGTVSRSARMDALKESSCTHHPPDETGEPMFDMREHLPVAGRSGR